MYLLHQNALRDSHIHVWPIRRPPEIRRLLLQRRAVRTTGDLFRARGSAPHTLSLHYCDSAVMASGAKINTRGERGREKEEEFFGKGPLAGCAGPARQMGTIRMAGPQLRATRATVGTQCRRWRQPEVGDVAITTGCIALSPPVSHSSYVPALPQMAGSLLGSVTRTGTQDRCHQHPHCNAGGGGIPQGHPPLPGSLSSDQ